MFCLPDDRFYDCPGGQLHCHSTLTSKSYNDGKVEKSLQLPFTKLLTQFQTCACPSLSLLPRKSNGVIPVLLQGTSINVLHLWNQEHELKLRLDNAQSFNKFCRPFFLTAFVLLSTPHEHNTTAACRSTFDQSSTNTTHAQEAAAENEHKSYQITPTIFLVTNDVFFSASSQRRSLPTLDSAPLRQSTHLIASDDDAF